MRRATVIMSIGVALVAIAAGVRFIAAPVFVRFPLGIDRHYTYTGDVTAIARPRTLAPVTLPSSLPVTVDRSYKGVSGGYSTAVVREKVTTRIAGRSTTETYRYALGRRSMQLQNGSDTYAFGKPADTMDVGSSYRVSLPLGTGSSSTYRGFVPQSDSTTTLHPQGAAHHDPVSDSKVITFAYSTDHTVAPYYLAHLQSEGYPTKLTPTAAAADLRARGVNVAAFVAALRSHLTGGQLAALTAVFAKPVPLTYSYFDKGTIGVDPTTGTVVDQTSSRQGVMVTPNLSAYTALAPILAPLASIPAVQSFATALRRLATAPAQPVLSFHVAETSASARAAVSDASSLATLSSLLEWWLPIGLAALGVLLVILGWFTRPRRRPEVASAQPSPTPQPEEPKLPV